MATEPDWVAPEGSWASSAEARNKMLANRSRDTKPELLVRSLVHRRGLRYRTSQRPLPELRRTADLIFRKVRVAVFIDGCYWHGCPEHYRRPRTNLSYWSEKNRDQCNSRPGRGQAPRRTGLAIPAILGTRKPRICSGHNRGRSSQPIYYQFEEFHLAQVLRISRRLRHLIRWRQERDTKTSSIQIQVTQP